MKPKALFFKNKILKLILMTAFCIGIYLYFRSGNTYLPVEDLYIPSIIAVDINKYSTNDIEYVGAISVYNFSDEGKITSTTKIGKASSLPEIREQRQLTSDHKFILGLEKVDVYGIDLAKFSLHTFINVTFINPNINDTSLICVYNGKVTELLNIKPQNQLSIGDTLEGLLKRSTEYNFFSSNYKLMDMYVRLDAEGRNIVLPLVGVKKNEPQIIGMALFNHDKMVTSIDMYETKAMNLLRENNVKGQLTLQKNPKDSLVYYASSKRKVKCTKKNGKYYFQIELSLAGDVTSNSLFDNISESEDSQKLFEKSISSYTEKYCENFINKMQKNYKIDCLELGEVAASKYGRRTGVDWNKIICENSVINVKVTSKIVNTGRGQY
ncbi:Ger(x)C family spore germination protein [Haloimpatiens sp. FM7315]|uniref:Ger(x)C family spore germination protein n=1 Tax=Haloimpatiens sp. FM7315 TaxID=3298609 RepID=UPI003709FBFF